jgi:hypothetical protein
MMKLLAGVFAGAASLVGGLFGHGGADMHFPFPFGNASTTQEASTTHPMMEHHMGSTTPWAMGSTTAGMMREGDGVMGKVLSINGTSFTLSPMRGMGMGSSSAQLPATLTVDASAAKIMKNATTTISVSDIKVGDMVLVEGKRSGSTITAQVVLDGLPPHGAPGSGQMHPGMAGMKMGAPAHQN